MAESFGFRATYFSRSLYRIQDQRPRSCHLFCDMIWRWEMVSIFHQWHNLSLTLTLQPEEISITCRPGGPGSTKMEMKKIPQIRRKSLLQLVIWSSESAPGFSEEKTKLCYAILRLKPARSLLAPATQEEQTQFGQGDGMKNLWYLAFLLQILPEEKEKRNGSYRLSQLSEYIPSLSFWGFAASSTLSPEAALPVPRANS